MLGKICADRTAEPGGALGCLDRRRPAQRAVGGRPLDEVLDRAATDELIDAVVKVLGPAGDGSERRLAWSWSRRAPGCPDHQLGEVGEGPAGSPNLGAEPGLRGARDRPAPRRDRSAGAAALLWAWCSTVPGTIFREARSQATVVCCLHYSHPLLSWNDDHRRKELVSPRLGACRPPPAAPAVSIWLRRYSGFLPSFGRTGRRLPGPAWSAACPLWTRRTGAPGPGPRRLSGAALGSRVRHRTAHTENQRRSRPSRKPHGGLQTPVALDMGCAGIGLGAQGWAWCCGQEPRAVRTSAAGSHTAAE